MPIPVLPGHRWDKCGASQPWHSRARGGSRWQRQRARDEEGSLRAGARGGRGGRVTAPPPSATATRGTHPPPAAALLPQRLLKIKVWGENAPAEPAGDRAPSPPPVTGPAGSRRCSGCSSALLHQSPEDGGPPLALGSVQGSGCFLPQASPILDAVLPGWKHRGRGCPRSKYKGIYFMGTRERDSTLCVLGSSWLLVCTFRALAGAGEGSGSRSAPPAPGWAAAGGDPPVPPVPWAPEPRGPVRACLEC